MKWTAFQYRFKTVHRVFVSVLHMDFTAN